MSESVAVAELELVASAVGAGQSVAAVAQTLGMSERSVHRRLALPECQDLIAEQRRHAAEQIRDGVIAGALVGLQRLVDTVADPESPAGAAVSASKYLVDLAIGPGGVGALQQALDQAEKAAEPEPEESTVSVIRRRLAAMHANQTERQRVLQLVEQARSPAAGTDAPVWSG